MRSSLVIVAALLGLTVGMLGTMLIQANHPQQVSAGSNDRYQDYIMCTGSVAINPRAQTDGVWLLDYRTGKLLGTVIDRTVGKINGWAEVDLVQEFGIPPRQDVHFMMTTGSVAQGQAALYVTEVTTGKFGVYTMGPNPEGAGIVIRRHDMTAFRAAKPDKKLP